MSETWTLERTKSLIELWANGLSAKQIAERLELSSRSMVIGKVRRLDLPTPEKKLAWTVKRQARAKAINVAKIAPKTIEHHATDEALHLSLIDLEPGQCRFPFGDGPFTFCGHPIVAGSYCGLHDYICHEVRA